MAILVFGRFNRVLRVRVLLLLLLRAVGHVRFHADVLFLWIHANRCVCCVHHAWHHRFSVLVFVCSPHLQSHQMRLGGILEGGYLPPKGEVGGEDIGGTRGTGPERRRQRKTSISLAECATGRGDVASRGRTRKGGFLINPFPSPWSPETMGCGKHSGAIN